MVPRTHVTLQWIRGITKELWGVRGLPRDSAECRFFSSGSANTRSRSKQESKRTRWETVHLQAIIAVLAIEYHHCLSNLTNAEQWRRKVIYAGWSTGNIGAPHREVSLPMGGGTVRQWNGFMLPLVEAMGAKLCPHWNSASTYRRNTRTQVYSKMTTARNKDLTLFDGSCSPVERAPGLSSGSSLVQIQSIQLVLYHRRSETSPPGACKNWRRP